MRTGQTSPWIGFDNCSLRFRSRNKISPFVFKSKSCLRARKLKQVFVHHRRVKIYLKTETCKTFAFNSSMAPHPECLPCLTFLRSRPPPKKLFTPLGHERCLHQDRHLGTAQQSGNSRTYWRKDSVNRRVFSTASTAKVLHWFVCPG